MDKFSIFVVLFALYGAFLNSNGRPRTSFQIWLFTNAFFAIYNIYLGVWSQAFLFGAYFLTAINGLLKCEKSSQE